MTTERLVRIAFFGAVLSVAKWALSFIPNLELVSLLIVVYALAFGGDVFWIILIFVLTEGLQWGFGLWWISYLYVWPMLAASVLSLRRVFHEEFLLWAVVSGSFGLSFGLLFAIAYLPVDPAYALNYWITGLPWDVWHGACNFVLVLVLGRPLYRVLDGLERKIN